MRISVCVTVEGPAPHLDNLIAGLRHNTRPPADLLVAVRGEGRIRLPDASFPANQIVLDSDEATPAEARNRQARRATGDLLLFLDPHCIPAPTMLADYAAAPRAGIMMGEVQFLPRGAADTGIDYGRFGEVAVPHEDRPDPAEGTIMEAEDFRKFSALNFAVTAGNFARIGGFDEGYACAEGAEFDFARAAAEHSLPLRWLPGACTFHQYHPQHLPPVDRLDDVLSDARRFEKKWGEPVMESWLRTFTLMRLVKREPTGWVKLRDPSEADLALTRQQENQPFASSAQVLRWLEERAVHRLDPAKGPSKSTAAA